MTFDLGISLGLISIALALFFGMFLGLRDIRATLTEIKTNTAQIPAIAGNISKTRQRVDDIWEAIISLLRQRSGTVELMFKNLGRIRISAKPAREHTVYRIETSAPVLDEELIIKLKKETGFEANLEIPSLGKAAACHVPMPTLLVLHLPSTDPAICTKYLRQFLSWLDDTYYREREQIIKAFEEPLTRQ